MAATKTAERARQRRRGAGSEQQDRRQLSMTHVGRTDTRTLSDWLETAEFFHGEATPPLCRYYVRWPDSPPGGVVSLSGYLMGPRCAYSQTLEAKYPLVIRGGPHGWLGEAIIPDPCYWTPQLPFLYRIMCEARSPGGSARLERTIGMRLLTVERQSLFLERKRWVFRAVCRDHFPTESIDQWRRVEASLLVRNPDDATCDAASRSGVLIGAIVDRASWPDVAADLMRLSRWPAVGIAFLRIWAPGPESSSGASPGAATAPLAAFEPPRHLLRGHLQRPGEPLRAPAWAQVVLLWAESLRAAPPVLQSDAEARPIVALRRSQMPKSLEFARSEIDRLQRDLAPRGDFAGYAV